MKRVIITGGDGFIGRHLVKRLTAFKPISVVVISKTSSTVANNAMDKQLKKDLPLTFYTADIRDRENISDIFHHERVDTCVHLAAKISVSESVKNPTDTMNINAEGTINVLDACYNSHVNNFIFASSAAVYGDVKELPIRENQKLRPLSPYGTSKMLAEKHISSYCRLKKIQKAIILRIFNIYGYSQGREGDVISKFLGRISKGLSPVIYGGGENTRDFISIDDVVHFILMSIKLMDEKDYSSNKVLRWPMVFNVGTGIPTSIIELAKKIIEISGVKLQPMYEKGTQSAGVISHSYADITKAKEILHFVPKKGIDAGLKEMIGAITSRNE